MIDDMGIFRTNIELASTLNPDRRVSLDDVMVDTGSEYNWVPEAVLADLGVTPVRVDRFETADGRISNVLSALHCSSPADAPPPPSSCLRGRAR